MDLNKISDEAILNECLLFLWAINPIIVKVGWVRSVKLEKIADGIGEINCLN